MHSSCYEVWFNILRPYMATIMQTAIIHELIWNILFISLLFESCWCLYWRTRLTLIQHWSSQAINATNGDHVNWHHITSMNYNESLFMKGAWIIVYVDGRTRYWSQWKTYQRHVLFNSTRRPLQTKVCSNGDVFLLLYFQLTCHGYG